MRKLRRATADSSTPLRSAQNDNLRKGRIERSDRGLGSLAGDRRDPRRELRSAVFPGFHPGLFQLVPARRAARVPESSRADFLIGPSAGFELAAAGGSLRG